MRPPEEEIGLLVAGWIKKADLDFKTVVRLSADACRSYVESQCALGWVLIAEPFDDEGYSGASLGHRTKVSVALESVLYDNKTWTVTVRLVSQNDKTVAFPLNAPDEFSNSGRK